MNRRWRTIGLWSWLIAPTVLAASSTPATDAPQVKFPQALSVAAPKQSSTQSAQEEEELGEIVVEGRRPIKDPQQAFNWLARLVGSFTVDGSVDLHGKGDPEDLRPVTGRSTCTGFGLAPGVVCDLNIRWPETKEPDGEEIPGGVSTLDPAMMLYGFEGRTTGIAYSMVDSKGISEGAVGYLLTEDMLVTRRPCASIPGNCERVVRITASPDLREVQMKIDIRIDDRKPVRYEFVMHRVPGSPSEVIGRKNK